jgi:hypothetical protein
MKNMLLIDIQSHFFGNEGYEETNEYINEVINHLRTNKKDIDTIYLVNKLV